MSQLIEITGATGTGPYDIEVCDITLSLCVPIASSVPIPPTYQFPIPLVLEGVNEVIVKLTDSEGCTTLELISCNTPSQTPTPTLTPTPTMITWVSSAPGLAT